MNTTLRTQVRIPTPLATWLKDRAKEDGRSMNAQLTEYLKRAHRRESKTGRK